MSVLDWVLSSILVWSVKGQDRCKGFVRRVDQGKIAKQTASHTMRGLREENMAEPRVRAVFL